MFTKLKLCFNLERKVSILNSMVADYRGDRDRGGPRDIIRHSPKFEFAAQNTMFKERRPHYTFADDWATESDEGSRYTADHCSSGNQFRPLKMVLMTLFMHGERNLALLRR